MDSLKAAACGSVATIVVCGAWGALHAQHHHHHQQQQQQQ